MQIMQRLFMFSVLAIFPMAQGISGSLSRTTVAQAATSTASDVIFADSFETGNLSAWSSNVTDSGDLSASTSAALAGGQGLKAVLDDNNSIFVIDDCPNAEPRYRARFYFDPNSISMVSGEVHYIFNGFKGTSPVLRMEFRKYSGNYQLRGRLLNDAGSWISTNWINLSDASHFIELDWRSASNTGGLTLWIDGAQQVNLTTVDNDTKKIDQARLGAVGGVDSGTRGTYFFDAFESRRQTYIGPAGSVSAPTATRTSGPTATKTALPLATSTPTATRAVTNTPAWTPTATKMPLPTAGSTQIVFAPSNEDFANPERGFMKQSSVFPDQPFEASKVRALQSSDSLVWIYFRLDNYRTKLIDQNGLNTIRSAFGTARSKGLKLVVRFVYNPGPGSTSDPNLANPDAPIDLVLQHIDQLKPILMENADVIAVVQAGFVGHWGEWHSTKYLHPIEYRKAIVDALLSALPADRMLQLRYPRHKEIFYQGPLTAQEAFSGTDQSRVGHHNDCFLQGNDDSITYQSSSPQLPKQASTYCDGQNEIACWKGYVAQEGNFTPVGGETCQYNPPRTDCPNVLQEMEMLHWSFINNGYKREVLDSWTTGGCMDTIRRRLGYRLVLEQAFVPTTIKPGGTLSVKVNLRNEGFASMYNPRPVYLVLLGQTNRYEIPLTNIDPRRWAAGQSSTIDVNVNIPTNAVAGTYKLALWLPDAYASLRNSPAYSVRFANANVWDAATGLNILTPTLQVQP